jgi:hypothetical protein
MQGANAVTTVTLNATSFREALNACSKETGLEMVDVLYWQMSIWCQDLIKKTQTNPSWSFPQQKMAGERAVASDIFKIFFPLTDEKWWDCQKDKEGYVQISTAKGSTYLVEKSMFMEHASQNEMESFHQSKRNGRGRVPKGSGKAKGSHAGLPVSGQTHVRSDDLEKYIFTKMQHVGRTKSAWLSASGYFRSKIKNSPIEAGKGAPEWVTRNVGWGSGYGASSDNLNATSMTGSIESSNDVPWTRPDVLAVTFETRIKDLQNYAALRLDKIMKKYSASGSVA